MHAGSAKVCTGAYADGHITLLRLIRYAGLLAARAYDERMPPIGLAISIHQ